MSGNFKAARGHGSSPQPSLKDRLLRLLRAGPMATTTLAKQVTIEDNGLEDPAELSNEPYRTSFKYTRTKILRALTVLEKQKRVIGEDLILVQNRSVATQVRWWRLPTAKERKAEKVDKALSRRLAQRILPQIQPSLARMSHWQALLKQQPAQADA